ncbi:MAG: SdrD B-like domain-containing protein [Deltaproteobacteria bacterium]
MEYNTVHSDNTKNELIENLIPSPLSTINISTWVDYSEDGIKQAGEIGLQNITLQLYNQYNNLVSSGISGPDGSYIFSSVPNGKYRVRFGKFAGLVYTLQDKGNDDNLDSDVDQTGYSEFFIINSTSDNYNISCGFRGNLQVFLGNNIAICKGESVDLQAVAYFGKSPFLYQWDNGLGNGDVKTVTPLTTTTYHVTITDNWGFTANGQITVRVKNGVGQENFVEIDAFNSGSTPPVSVLVVDPINRGPNSIIDYSNSGIIGNYRKVDFEYYAGINPASLQINYGDAFFSNSNDVGASSKTKLTYNSNNQGLNFNISNYQYFKFKDLGIDQGEVILNLSIIDNNNNIAASTIKLPGLGTTLFYDKEVFFETIQGFNTINKSEIKELSFEFLSENSSIDFRLGDIWICEFSDCPVKSNPNNVSICAGDSVIIGADVECANMVNFLWDHNLGYGKSFKVSPNVTTTYTVVASDAYGCSSIDTVRVNVSQIPVVSMVQNYEICQSDSLIINPLITGGLPPYSFIWSNGSSTSSIKVSPDITTIYSVTVSDANNCSADIAKTTVIVLPEPLLSVSSTLADCAESNGSASATATGGNPPYSFIWQNGSTGSSLNNIPAGNYKVTVTDAKGCKDSKTVVVAEKDCGLIGNFVWEDLDYNGIQDIGEPGIADVMVILTDGNQAPKDTTFTDNNGQYYFYGLKEGNYFTQFKKPGGFLSTKLNIGNDKYDSDADLITGFSHLIELAKYEKDSTIDAGFYRLVSIGDTVWVDKDGDGLQNPGESGLPGFDVELLDCNDNFIATTKTDQFGKYEFTGLNPGNYRIRFILNGNYKFINMNVGNNVYKDSDANIVDGKTVCENLKSGEKNTSYDAGVYLPPKIGNFVWEDLNANGIQDAGEPGLANIPVTLSTCSGTPISTINTNANGYYLFDNLVPGNYKISVAKPASYIYSPANVASDDTDSDINVDGFTVCEFLESGEENLTYDIGMYRSASIGDRVWVDKNANGIQDNGENGISGVRVDVETCGGSLIGTKNTDAGGFYLFENLVPGSYRIRFYLPDDYKFTIPDLGSDSQDSDADILNGITLCETLTSGEVNLTYDAGIYLNAAIGDKVWLDENGNGIQDTGEPGFENVQVRLLSCAGNLIDTKYTDPAGNYLFTGIKPGSYRLHFIAPANYSFTHENIGADDKDSDPLSSTGMTVCEDLESGETNLTYDAGLLFFGSIGNYVWEDIDGDGIQESAEPGISGVELKLYRWSNGAFVFDQTTTTNYQGYYLFDNLAPGNYYVKITPPSGFNMTIPNSGSNDLTDSDSDNSNGLNTTKNIELGPGEDDMSWDFGLYRCATVGDLIWNDAIRNNVYDSSEGGIDGVNVRLWRKNGANWMIWDQTFTTYNPNSTCGSGFWSFCTNPGEYYVEIVGIQNGGYVHVTPNTGTNEETDSDLTDAFGLNTSNSFILLSGGSITNLDGGFYKNHTVKGKTWKDLNSDGLQTSNEPRFQGIIVELFNTNGLYASSTTDNNGNYLFNDVPEGNYYLKFSLPANYIFTLPEVGTNDNIDSDVTHENGTNTTQWFTIQNQSEILYDAGYRSSTSGLPFGFRDLNGVNMKEYNQINWSTRNDDNITHFEVMRNLNNDDFFNMIEIVNSNKSEESTYQVEDYDITKIGSYRYKIKAIENNSNTYSKEILIDVKMNLGYSIFPNPASTILEFEYLGKTDELISIFISDLFGKVYLKSENLITKAETKFMKTFDDLNKLPPGVYQLVVKVRNETFASKFVKVSK